MRSRCCVARNVFPYYYGGVFGWGLRRSETLADGCQRCHFRFKKGGETEISSLTPDVQATIEKIREKEVCQP